MNDEIQEYQLRQAKAWRAELLYERLDRCCTMLVVHGCVTHAESDRIRDKIQKHLSAGRYHEVRDD